MPKPGPRTTRRYSPPFKATAVRLSQLPGVRVQLGLPQDPDDLFFAVPLLHGVLLASKGKRTHLPTGYTFRLRSAHESELLPDLGDSARLYMRILMSFLAASGSAEVYADLQKKAAAMPTEVFDLEAERVRGAVLSHRDWIVANNARCQLRARWREFFKAFDALICPVSPVTAFPHDHSDREARRILIDGEPHPYGNQLIWPGVATLPGLPATSVPIGMSPQGLPIGVQIVGPSLEDRTPLKLAELIESAFGGFVPPQD